MVYKIPEYRPQMRRGSSTVDAENETPALAYDNVNSDIHITTSVSWVEIILTWVKSLLGFVVFAAVIVTILYITLASTLLFVTDIGGKQAFVARSTFLGGVPDEGALVVDSTSQVAKTDPLSRLQTAFTGIPGARVTEIVVAQDGVRVSGDGSTVTISSTGESFPGTLYDADGKEIRGNVILQHQVLGRCVMGECAPDSYNVISLDRVYGEYRESIFDGKGDD